MRVDSSATDPGPYRLSASTNITRIALAIATLAMVALHVVQPTLHPIDRPISFYVHGEHGWLLPLSLGAFGIASFAASLAPPATLSRGSARSLALFGIGMLVTALVPSDRWFPWENDPTVPGLIHAAIAIIAPVLLLHPMLAPLRANRESVRRRVLPTSRAVAVLYAAALFGSGLSLASGLLLDRPPPWIGLTERVLALSAAAWLACAAWPPPSRGRTGVNQRASRFA